MTKRIGPMTPEKAEVRIQDLEIQVNKIKISIDKMRAHMEITIPINTAREEIIALRSLRNTLEKMKENLVRVISQPLDGNAACPACGRAIFTLYKLEDEEETQGVCADCLLGFWTPFWGQAIVYVKKGEVK